MAAAEPASRRWGVAVGAAAAGVLAVLMLFRAPRPPARPPGAPGGGLKVVLTPALTAAAALFDPAPLFLPTDRNGTVEVPPPQSGGAFADFPAQLILREDQLHFGLRSPIAVPARPADALFANPPGNLLMGIGQTDAGVPQLAPRSAFVEITAAATGRRVFSGPLADAHPPEPFGPDRRPVEYMALVAAAGLVGAPVSASSSGSGALDDYFAHYLARRLWVGDRLTPGIYRIRVGP